MEPVLPAGANEVWAKHRGGLLVPEAGDLTVSEEFPLKDLTVLPGFTGSFNEARTHQRIKERARQVGVVQAPAAFCLP